MARRHLEEVGGGAVDGQGVVEVIDGVVLAAARRVGQRLICLLDGLEVLLNGHLAAVVGRRRARLVRVVLQRRPPVA